MGKKKKRLWGKGGKKRKEEIARLSLHIKWFSGREGESGYGRGGRDDRGLATCYTLFSHIILVGKGEKEGRSRKERKEEKKTTLCLPLLPVCLWLSGGKGGGKESQREGKRREGDGLTSLFFQPRAEKKKKGPSRKKGEEEGKKSSASFSGSRSARGEEIKEGRAKRGGKRKTSAKGKRRKEEKKEKKKEEGEGRAAKMSSFGFLLPVMSEKKGGGKRDQKRKGEKRETNCARSSLLG